LAPDWAEGDKGSSLGGNPVPIAASPDGGKFVEGLEETAASAWGVIRMAAGSDGKERGEDG
jgi:hypothetical protein